MELGVDRDGALRPGSMQDGAESLGLAVTGSRVSTKDLGKLSLCQQFFGGIAVTS